MDILLVEDNAISRQVTAAVLAKAGYGVRACESGQAALARLQREPISAVLLDAQLPDWAGSAVAQQIRALPAPVGTVPIVVLTAHEAPELHESVLEAGATAVLVKPLAIDRLRAVLAEPASDPAPAASQAPGAAPRARLDRDQLIRMVGHLGPDERAELAGLLDQRRRGLAAGLATYRHHGTAGELAHQAHKMKGACGYLGLLAAQDDARALEAAAQGAAGDPLALAERLLADLPADRDRLAAALTEAPLQPAGGHNT